mgnify:CR=1 FL=1
MIDDKTAFQMADQLREYCDRKNCDECPFAIQAYAFCVLNDDLPRNWQLGHAELFVKKFVK